MLAQGSTPQLNVQQVPAGDHEGRRAREPWPGSSDDLAGSGSVSRSLTVSSAEVGGLARSALRSVDRGRRHVAHRHGHAAHSASRARLVVQCGPELGRPDCRSSHVSRQAIRIKYSAAAAYGVLLAPALPRLCEVLTCQGEVQAEGLRQVGLQRARGELLGRWVEAHQGPRLSSQMSHTEQRSAWSRGGRIRAHHTCARAANLRSAISAISATVKTGTVGLPDVARRARQNRAGRGRPRRPRPVGAWNISESTGGGLPACWS